MTVVTLRHGHLECFVNFMNHLRTVLKKLVYSCNFKWYIIFLKLQVDPVRSLPGELARRVQVFFKALLGYCMNILTSSDKLSLPDDIRFGKSAERLANYIPSCICHQRMH